ncbi:hypothetical protein QJS66_15580 [Kocuria rhizophila]|nr:hypothetical protein QJS66_15580 [Kocuria rhizophila]
MPRFDSRHCSRLCWAPDHGRWLLAPYCAVATTTPRWTCPCRCDRGGALLRGEHVRAAHGVVHGHRRGARHGLHAAQHPHRADPPGGGPG